ncbi:hypothetical protein Bca4012_033002 [Brassica carinata]
MSSSTNNDVQIIEPHPDCRLVLERTALLVSKKELEMERRIRNSNFRNAKFNFLNSSDPCHPFYQQKLTEYREAPPNQEPYAPVVVTTDHPECKGPPSSFTFELEPPHWITLKEHATLKLTAQSVARYGMSFLEALINKDSTNPHLGFIKFNDPRCYYFIHLVSAYSRVLRPSETDGASTETFVKGFLEQLQILLEKDDEEGLEMAMSDLDAVVGCVDHMEDQESFAKMPLPDHLLMGMYVLNTLRGGMISLSHVHANAAILSCFMSR